MAQKGQGALEYLMTYGWALLIVVIVGAALFALGVLNPATYQKSACTGFTYFTYQEHSLQADESLSLVFLNGNRDVTITEVTVNGNAANLTDVAVAPGAKTTIDTGAIAGLTDRNAGDTYSGYTVVISYNTADITGRTDAGTCTGKVE